RTRRQAHHPPNPISHPPTRSTVTHRHDNPESATPREPAEGLPGADDCGAAGYIRKDDLTPAILLELSRRS
ncbi:hypothetical protein AB1484_38180, partial [Parafrankia sp. FMc6]